jgi:hypothetical protein
MIICLPFRYSQVGISEGGCYGTGGSIGASTDQRNIFHEIEQPCPFGALDTVGEFQIQQFQQLTIIVSVQNHHMSRPQYRVRRKIVSLRRRGIVKKSDAPPQCRNDNFEVVKAFLEAQLSCYKPAFR